MLHGTIGFILTISILVFVHELGHYLAARYYGVKVDVFSIGFGQELFGFYDKLGTRWKIAIIPLGGYVKMFGDAGPSSTVPSADIALLSAAQKTKTFFYQKYFPKLVIILGGPAFNLLFALLIFWGMLWQQGEVHIKPVIGSVLQDGPAELAGLQAGDTISSINDHTINDFTDIQEHITASNGKPLNVTFIREGKSYHLSLTPQLRYNEERKTSHYMLGIIHNGDINFAPLAPHKAFFIAARMVTELSFTIINSLEKIFTTTHGTDELRGTLTIAQESGNSLQAGASNFLFFLALLSINLGIINLLPIPILDGGHALLLTLKQVINGKYMAIAERYLYIVGGAIIIFLIVISTSNDIKSLLF